MKKVAIFLFIGLVGVAIGWILKSYYSKAPQNIIQQIKPRPLDKYTIDNLSKVKTQSSQAKPDPALQEKVKIEETLKENEGFTSYLFSFSFDPTMSGKEDKNVTGLMNIPSGKGPFPVIVMFRGYVDQKQYKTGDGTRKAGEYFAKNGFITIAPDFLGYGGSDKEAEDVFESRFQTYTTALTLINSVKSVREWNQKDIFLWGHSNGGQIVLTVLEITQKEYPTTLWAPLSKPFPYSILVYSDEASDSGKFLRGKLAKFEETYDADLYSLTNYLDRIKAPIQIHQGTNDDAVPVKWTNDLVKTFKDKDIDVKYLKYSGSDHNLNPAWNTVVARNLSFFKENLTR